jgi:hypothetical protein
MAVRSGFMRRVAIEFTVLILLFAALTLHVSKAHSMSTGKAATVREIEKLDQIQTLRILDARTVKLISEGWMLQLMVDGGLVEKRQVVEAIHRCQPIR